MQDKNAEFASCSDLHSGDLSRSGVSPPDLSSLVLSESAMRCDGLDLMKSLSLMRTKAPQSRMSSCLLSAQ